MGRGGYGGRGRGGLYTYRYTVTTRTTIALRRAAMRATVLFHWLIVRQSHKTVSTNHNLFEEKGKPKRRYRADSKHWFTTSFLQPLPYLVTPQVPENCQHARWSRQRHLMLWGWWLNCINYNFLAHIRHSVWLCFWGGEVREVDHTVDVCLGLLLFTHTHTHTHTVARTHTRARTHTQ